LTVNSIVSLIKETALLCHRFALTRIAAPQQQRRTPCKTCFHLSGHSQSGQTRIPCSAYISPV